MKSPRALAVAAALALAPLTLGTLACQQSQPDAEANAREQPLGRALVVAPLADAHPWSMALLTAAAHRDDPDDSELEASLGRRTGAAGRPAPDPILRAPERATLEALLASHEAAHARPEGLRPVYLDEGESWRLLFVEDADAVEVGPGQGLLRLVDTPAGLRLRLRLAKEPGAALRALTEARVGDRVALVDGDVVLMLPTIHEAITSGELELPPFPSGAPTPGADPDAASRARFESLR
ncbi:hypothetical protein PPSIR1_35837 [Plesiocystis pacifica SIR-1]|uniref:Uncharacterized protein n=1 Tax=Plesiocystis pacifica SIR-1 TaxID=391625 RepID=A6G1U6_9BACT|nr:hypothetical protein [Plesiocystis pacifica]EDM80136.1 hypothetical protein PPSIR1_35837 [Plesiocystis pacifica SIR-1]